MRKTGRRTIAKNSYKASGNEKSLSNRGSTLDFAGMDFGSSSLQSLLMQSKVSQDGALFRCKQSERDNFTSILDVDATVAELHCDCFDGCDSVALEKNKTYAIGSR